MIARTIEYTDYNGNKRKEKHYFNLTQFEATQISLELPDGIVEELDPNGGKEDQQVVATHLVDKLGQKGVMDFIESIVLKSYGAKSPDGREFVKNEKLTSSFVQSPAYSAFMMRLLTDDGEASRFIQGVIPVELAAQMANRNQGSSKVIEMTNTVDTDEPADITD